MRESVRRQHPPAGPKGAVPGRGSVCGAPNGRRGTRGAASSTGQAGRKLNTPTRGVKIALALTGLWAGAAAAQPALPGWPQGILEDIDEMVTLPARAFHVVESGGRTVLVSSNGHYAVVNGALWDMWNGFRIQSVEDVERSKAIPLARLGIDDQALEGITLQSVVEPPGGRVTLFLDPAAPEGVDAVTAARGLLERYSFRLVFVPTHEGRYAATQSVLCAQTAAEAFVLSGRVARGAPSEPRCGLDAMHRNIALVQVLGIDALPFTVAPNGAVLPGVPTGYTAFLASNEE